MRNVIRVVLWGLPPSFCSLVQRAGRAGRDLTQKAEAILIIPKSTAKSGVSDKDVEKAIFEAVLQAEANNQESGTAERVDEEGVRVPDAQDSDGDTQPDDTTAHVTATSTKTKAGNKSKKTFAKDTNINLAEARALSEYATTAGCRERVWNAFFENQKKCQYEIKAIGPKLTFISILVQLEYLVNTSYKPILGMLCCDNDTP